MASTIGWVDISPRDKDRVKKFLEMMGTGGVQDELGVGVIRDAMSNKLFPGFSTLYTRAKYFFITPYLITDILEKNDGTNISAVRRFEQAEIKANEAIREFFRNHPELKEQSYFCKDKGDGKLTRQPSEIYWNGIITLKLVTGDKSLAQILNRPYSLQQELLSNDKGEDVTREQGENLHNSITNINCYTSDWIEYISTHGLELSDTEKGTLRDRLIKYTPDSLPAALVSDEKLWGRYKDAAEAGIEEPFLNPMLRFIKGSYDDVNNEVLRKNLIMAHDLSLFLHGLHIAYNIAVRTEAQHGITELKEKGRKWRSGLQYAMIDYPGFDINSYFTGVNIKSFTKEFLQKSQESVIKYQDWDSVEKELCCLARGQEMRNKTTKSRFEKIKKNGVAELEDEKKWLGLGLINYRYYSALSVIKDIYEGC